MNDRQNAKLNMAQRVSDTCKRYKDEYKGLPAVVSAVAALNKDIENIRELLKERAEVNVSAATLAKRTAEKNMIVPCVKMANALYIIGFIHKNQELITLYGSSEYSFYSLTNNATLALAKRVLNLSKKYAEQLEEYGINSEKINETEKAITEFQSLIAKPMDKIGERKQKTTNLVQLFAKLDATFYDYLDRAIILFKHSSPNFYGEYRTARNIIFQNEGKSKPKKLPTT